MPDNACRPAVGSMSASARPRSCSWRCGGHCVLENAATQQSLFAELGLLAVTRSRTSRNGVAPMRPGKYALIGRPSTATGSAFVVDADNPGAVRPGAPR